METSGSLEGEENPWKVSGDVMFQSTIGCKFSLLVRDWLNRHILFGRSLESWGGG